MYLTKGENGLRVNAGQDLGLLQDWNRGWHAGMAGFGGWMGGGWNSNFVGFTENRIDILAEEN